MADYDDTPTFVIETRGGDGVGAFLLGALLGAAAAFLLAPRSGAETQAEIAGAARRLRDGVTGRIEDARDSVTTRVGGTRDRVTGRVTDTREGVSRRLDSVRGRVESRVEQARAALEVSRDTARDARQELQRRVDDAKAAYRDGLSRRRGGTADEGEEGGNGAAPEVIVGEPVQEEPGDLG